MIDKYSKIYVAGHTGLVGSAIVRALNRHGYDNLMYVSHQELDLKNYDDVLDLIQHNSPDLIILAAARVGGIGGNSKDNAGFLYDNMMINMNVINAAYMCDVQNLLFLGSSCIYPKFAEQPIKEESLLTGMLEQTNEGYALAKIAGMKYCQFIRRQYGLKYHSLMPCNLYGPNDNYDLETCHVLPALLRKFIDAKHNNDKTVTVWGDGSPLREFLHSDDLAEAVVKSIEIDDPPDIMNVGSGIEITIAELANIIKNVVGYSGDIVFDTSKPNGTPRKVIDSLKIRSYGWKPTIDIKDGINEIFHILMK